jgi:hypothetical protein
LITIPSHPFGSNRTLENIKQWERDCDELREFVERCPSEGGRLVDLQEIDTCWAHSLGASREAHRFLSLAVDLCACTFAAANAATESIEFEFDGQAVRGPSAGPRNYVAGWDLYVGLLYGTALQKKRQVETLLAHDASARFPGGHPSHFHVSLARGMSAWLKHDPSWKEHFEYAQFLTAPENLQDYSLSEVQVYTSIIPVIHAIDAGSQKAFTEAVVNAVKAHKKHFGRGARSKQGTSVLAIHASCAAAIGVQRGLVFEVESSYAPRWLVEGALP